MLWVQAVWRVDKILFFTVEAWAEGRAEREALAPGGRFSSARTPGVSQIPKRMDGFVWASWILSCWAWRSGETAELKTVARAATEIACTTKRVLLTSEEPRGKTSSGTLLNAATKEVCRVRPKARPRRASRKIMYGIGVAGPISES